ncbi:hypothetical protein ACWCP6_15730 [Streptomyces sp. NPDC002004]
MSVEPSPKAPSDPQPDTPPDAPSQDAGPVAQPPRAYEPGPSAGKLLSVLLLFVLAAVVVVRGGVYFSSGG